LRPTKGLNKFTETLLKVLGMIPNPSLRRPQHRTPNGQSGRETATATRTQTVTKIATLTEIPTGIKIVIETKIGTTTGTRGAPNKIGTVALATITRGLLQSLTTATVHRHLITVITRLVDGTGIITTDHPLVMTGATRET
jgi:hypothetical protein